MRGRGNILLDFFGGIYYNIPKEVSRFMVYPRQVKNVSEILTAEGFDTYIVGGSLRNIMMGKEPHDWDMTTSAQPSEIVRVFESRGFNVIKTGLKHGTVTIMADGMPIEITTFRIDGSYTDARHPDSVSFTRNLPEDLSRRDFTVNAMAVPVSGENAGKIIDLFGGREDLENKLLRCVGEPHKRFREDALRILRAFRFVSEHGFDIEEKTLEAIKNERDGLEKISRERVFSELSRILVGDFAEKALYLLSECEIVKYITLSNRKISPSLISGLPKHLEVRLAAFLSTHENPSEALSSLKVGNALRSRVMRLLSVCRREMNDDKREARRFICDFGDLSDDALCIAGVFGKADDSFSALVAETKGEAFPRSVSELAVSGSDILGIGARGKEIGEILHFLFERTLDDPKLNEKNTLLSLAGEKLQKTEEK